MNFGKKLFAPSALCVALCVAGSAVAQDIDYLGANRQVVSEAKAQPAAVPADVLLVDLERWHHNNDTFSARPLNTPGGMQHPGKRQGVLGFISYTAFEGGHPLYACIQNNWLDRFTSRDPNCEGHMHDQYMPITGYIASTQLPGTVPLYRCHRGGLKPNNWADLFDTTDVNCENVKYPLNDQILGYIWL